MQLSVQQSKKKGVGGGESVYNKLQKAHENMCNFKSMLSKFPTQKKEGSVKEQMIEVDGQVIQGGYQKQKQIMLELSDGWEYSGEVCEEKFHGFGSLMLNGLTIYSGEFKNGRMDGMGKLNYHEVFQEIVNVGEKWGKYQGEFRKGAVTGFGNLYLASREVIVGFFLDGVPQCFRKVQEAVITNN